MHKDTFTDCIVARLRSGSSVFVCYPDKMAELLDGDYVDDNATNQPPEPLGVYKVDVEFHFYQGFSEGFKDDKESDWELRLTNARPVSCA